MEALSDLVVTALAVLVQLGVPVVVLFIAGYRACEAERRRWRARSRPPRDEGRRDGSRGRQGRCCGLRWPAAGADSPDGKQSGLPCWQAAKTRLGSLQAECVDCELFLAPPARG